MTTLDLVCPADGGPLREEDGKLVSDRGAVYPLVAGVAVVVQGVRVEPQCVPARATIDQLLDALALGPKRRAAIEHAFSHRFVFKEEWIQVEADQFLHRVASSHEGLRNALEFDREFALSLPPVEAEPAPRASIFSISALRRAIASVRKPPPAVEEVTELPPRLSSIFTLSKLRPGACVSINVRLENRGSTTLTSHGEAPFRLSYYWIDANGVKLEGTRTELLDPLLPGRSITMPLFIQTPKKAGRFTLSIRSLHEDMRWFDDSPVEFDVDIGRGPSSVDDPKWQRSGRQFDYMTDHFEGVRLLAEWRDTLFDRPVERVVELGGNANPMIERFDAPFKYNIDFDAYGMIVGNLARADRDSTVTFIVADGMDLPMRPRSIDMIVLFATFHHFPDPIGLLSRLSDFVADDGLICLMCEPIGHMHPDTVTQEFLDEIRRGVNEQSFDLWEYQQMFDAAKLDVVAAQIDIGSAKIALRPRRG